MENFIRECFFESEVKGRSFSEMFSRGGVKEEFFSGVFFLG